MMEPVAFRASSAIAVEKPWAATGMKDRSQPNIINSLHLKADEEELHNHKLQARYAKITARETRCEELYTEDAELTIVAYGITSRIARTAVEKARGEGRKVGLFRPISLWPFPSDQLFAAASRTNAFLTVEMSAGQMIEDVKLAIRCSKPVYFYGRYGGVIASPKEIYQEIVTILDGKGGR
jgi:2-oxoglutarate ferredoxin oxidoreductase subunit alpha